MDQYNQQLYALRDKITRQAVLKDMLNSLQNNKMSLEYDEKILADACRKEQKDVNKLEGVSLPAILYSITGAKEEKIEKERQEANAIMTKYKAVCVQLEAVKQDIERYQYELTELSSCEIEFKQLLNDKGEYIKKTDKNIGEKIRKFEQQIQELRAQGDEIDEAYAVGIDIVNQIQSIKTSLDSAEGWGTWDVLGGGLISDMAKHSHLDDAEQKIKHLQELLNRYKTELEDIQILSEIQAEVEGFLYFADFFFDGLFADFAVLDHIQNSQRQVEDSYTQVKHVQSRLDRMRNDVESKIEQTQTALNEMILSH